MGYNWSHSAALYETEDEFMGIITATPRSHSITLLCTSTRRLGEMEKNVVVCNNSRHTLSNFSP